MRQREGFDAASAVIARHDDKELMDRVRTEAAALIAAERELLIQRQQLTRQHERNVLLAGVAIATLSVVMRLLVAWLLAQFRKQATAQSKA